ncbi:MAG: hypothetical protein HZA32_10175 [Opitutae bacterium]|nr:hypothetical protein [Opitutae bacterium]
MRRTSELSPPLLALLLSAAFALSASAATLTGRVALPARSGAPVVEQRYEIVIDGGVLRADPPRAIVYLAGDFPAPNATPSARIEQKGLAFVPRLLPVRVGTRVEFPNLDPVYHSVFSFSPTRRFDLGRYRADEAEVPAIVFDRAGLVTLRCDIHEHMRAAVLVLETPHFVVTDAGGRYRLENLPAGRYVLKAWLDSRTVREHAVELAADSDLVVDFP